MYLSSIIVAFTGVFVMKPDRHQKLLERAMTY